MIPLDKTLECCKLSREYKANFYLWEEGFHQREEDKNVLRLEGYIFSSEVKLVEWENVVDISLNEKFPTSRVL